MLSDADLVPIARRLRDLIEPVIAQVYFAPECHEGYASLGFNESPASARGVALPDGPAYFTSRGSCLGQVPGEVVASTFALFNPDAVVPAVVFGWSLTDAPTINAVRTRGAIAQLRRVLGDEPAGLSQATDLLRRAIEPLRPEGRSLYGFSPSACPVIQSETCGGWAICCGSTAAMPTPQRGRRPAWTPPRSGC